MARTNAFPFDKVENKYMYRALIEHCDTEIIQNCMSFHDIYDKVFVTVA